MDSSVSYKLRRCTRGLCSIEAGPRCLSGQMLSDLLVDNFPADIPADILFSHIQTHVLKFEASTNAEKNAHRIGLAMLVTALCYSGQVQLFEEERFIAMVRSLMEKCIQARDNKTPCDFELYILGEMCQCVPQKQMAGLIDTWMKSDSSEEVKDLTLSEILLLRKFYDANKNLAKKYTTLASLTKDSICMPILVDKWKLASKDLNLLVFRQFWMSKDETFFTFWDAVQKLLFGLPNVTKHKSNGNTELDSDEMSIQSKRKLLTCLFDTVLCPSSLLNRSLHRLPRVWSPACCALLQRQLSNDKFALATFCQEKMAALRQNLSKLPANLSSSVASHLFTALTEVNANFDQTLSRKNKVLPSLLTHLALGEACVGAHVEKLLSSLNSHSGNDLREERVSLLQHLSTLLSTVALKKSNDTEPATVKNLVLRVLDDALFTQGLLLTQSAVDVTLPEQRQLEDDPKAARRQFAEEAVQMAFFHALESLTKEGRGKRLEQVADGLSYEQILRRLLHTAIKHFKSLRVIRGTQVSSSFSTLLKTMKRARKLLKMKEGDSQNLHASFGILVGNLCLHWIAGARNMAPLLEDIQACYERTTKEEPTADEPQWMCVLTDALLSLIANPSHVLRSVVITVYRRLAPAISVESIHIIQERLLHNEEHGDNDEEEEEEVDGEEEMEKECNSTSEEESSDTEEEEENEDEIKEKRRRLAAALGKAALVEDSDVTSEEKMEEDGEQQDDDLDDEAMFAMNDRLEKALSTLMKKNTKQQRDLRQRMQVQERMRYLDLLEVAMLESQDPKVLCACLKLVLRLQSENESVFAARVRDAVRGLCERKLQPQTVEDPSHQSKKKRRQSLEVNSALHTLVVDTMKEIVQFKLNESDRHRLLMQTFLFLKRNVCPTAVQECLREMMDKFLSKKQVQNFPKKAMQLYFERMPMDLWLLREVLCSRAAVTLNPFTRTQALVYLTQLVKNFSHKDSANYAPVEEQRELASRIFSLAFAGVAHFCESAKAGGDVKQQNNPALLESSVRCAAVVARFHPAVMENVSAEDISRLLQVKALRSVRNDIRSLQRCLNMQQEKQHESMSTDVQNNKRTRTVSGTNGLPVASLKRKRTMSGNSGEGDAVK